jgi:hypothetical protein
MFKQYLTVLADVLEDAKKSPFIVRDHTVQNLILDYVKEHGLILSNGSNYRSESKNIDDDKALEYYSNVIIIYGDYIFKHANDISNLIALKTIYTSLITNIKNEDFTITVNGLPAIRLMSVHSRMLPAIHTVVKNETKQYPPELELIEIYHRLHQPQRASEWPHLLRLERMIRSTLNSSTTGGRREQKLNVNHDIVKRWVSNRKDYILIGRNAVSKATGGNITDKIQVIAGASFIADFTKYIEQFRGTPVIRKQPALLGHEPRLVKTSFQIEYNTTMYLLDVYNAVEYELIPYFTLRGVNIAHPYVLNMYALVDYWTFSVIAALGKKSQPPIAPVLALLKKIDAIEKKEHSYMGVNIEVEIYRKKEGLANPFFPYIPENHRYVKGNYRTV